MSTLVKVEASMVGGAVVGFAILALVARSLQARGVTTDTGALGRITFPYVMSLFLLFGFGLFGLALHGFIAGQVRLGNGERAPIAFLRRSETGVAIGLWSFLLVGAAVAVPAMRRDLFPDAPTVGESKGILRADVGMTLDEVRAASTLPLASVLNVTLTHTTQVIDNVVFDFEVRGSSVRFEKCRYYFMTTGPKEDPHVDSIEIGISPLKKPRVESEAAADDVRRRLAADGWAPGRFVWRTEKDLILNGGKPTSGEGRYWAKGDTLLILSSKRMDDAKPDEDPATAGEFILLIDLAPRTKSSYAGLEYGPAPADAGAPKPKSGDGK